MIFRLNLLCLSLLIVVTTTAFSQNGLLSPDKFLPHQLGEHFTPHHLLVDYFEHVAENSDHITLQEYGITNEKRPLIYAVISSKKNMARLDEIRVNNLRRTGMTKGTVQDDDIAVVWLSFGVHGNEAGASESSLATIYELAQTNNQEIQNWLKNTVVIVDPCVNPDGYSRYTHWNWGIGNQIVNPDPVAAEHHEPWPGGRVNHYLFDLNRDWAWQTQVESQQRLKVYHQWMPHIHVDFHEQYHNDPYYFAPAAQPYHAYITQWQGDFQTDIGKNNAKYFDENGWLYYTREIFDLFYPSYGDTYPTFNGAIGMTYEQGGHSMAGRAILLNNGDTLQLMDRITHHKTTALSTIEVSAKNADKLTQQFSDYFKTSQQSPRGDYKSYVVKAGNTPKKISHLCDFLDSHGIQYGAIENTRRGVNAFHYQSGSTSNVDINTGDLVISAHQPMSILTQVLFEPEPFLMDSLTYDITAWALPYAYGLDAYAFKEDIGPGRSISKNKFTDYQLNQKAYAYLSDWNTLEDVNFLNALQNKNVQVRVASNDFNLDGRAFSRGTLVINRGDNRKLSNQFDRIVLETANEMQQLLTPVQSGFSTTGPDLGSDQMKLLKKPKVVILSGEETNANAFGYLWHFFDQEMKIQTTNIAVKDLNEKALRDFNVLVMTDGDYGSLDSAAMVGVTNWIQSGGKLIAMGSALYKLTDKNGFKITPKKAPEAVATTTPKMTHYAGQERRSIANSIPGAIYKVKMDSTHPLAYGISDAYQSLKTTAAAFNYLEGAWNVGYIDKKPDIKGFVGFDAKKKLHETTVFGVQPMGSGQVVYMVDNPLFRGFWRQGKFLFSNAVFML